MAFTLDEAQRIVSVTLSYGRDNGWNPLSAVVLDAGGHPIAFARSDGASPGRFAIAEAKAYGAIMLGMGGRAQMARAEAQGYFVNAVNGIFNGKMLPVPGGVLVRDADGAVIGAVGVTGDSSDNDAEAACAGIVAVGYTPEA